MELGPVEGQDHIYLQTTMCIVHHSEQYSVHCTLCSATNSQQCVVKGLLYAVADIFSLISVLIQTTKDTKLHCDLCYTSGNFLLDDMSVSVTTRGQSQKDDRFKSYFREGFRGGVSDARVFLYQLCYCSVSEVNLQSGKISPSQPLHCTAL